MAIFSKKENEEESRKIIEKFKKLFSQKKISFHDSSCLVFLCGATLENNESVRFQIENYYKENKQNLHKNREIVFLSSEAAFQKYETISCLLFNQSVPVPIDLNSFETIIASVSDCLLIALESHGAIAELGYFSAFEELREKTLIVLEQEHGNATSFIRLGPLSLIEAETYYKPMQYYSFPETEKKKSKYLSAENLNQILRLILNKEIHSKKLFSFEMKSFNHKSNKKGMSYFCKFIVLSTIFIFLEEVYFRDIKFILEEVFPETKFGSFRNRHNQININWQNLAILISLIVSTGLFEIVPNGNLGPYIKYKSNEKTKLILKLDEMDLLNCSEGVRLIYDLRCFYEKLGRSA